LRNGKSTTARSRKLKDKCVLVTGASGGIGFQIAQQFLQRGARVGVHYCQSREGAEELARNFPADRCAIFQADFSESRQVRVLWDKYIAWAGAISVLVNNAGDASVPMPLGKFSEDVWDRAFQINLKAPVILSQAAMKVMQEASWGRIINISSIGVKYGGGVTSAHYSASKAALEAITLSFAKEGAPHNILVNAIRAGVTDTSIHEKMGRKDLAGRAQLIPLKRVAQPDEIANMVLFLASEESSFITGGILPVAGGE
jgi:3-oxoacyl-[acyl-carrier protein] reductase